MMAHICDMHEGRTILACEKDDVNIASVMSKNFESMNNPILIIPFRWKWRLQFVYRAVDLAERDLL